MPSIRRRAREKVAQPVRSILERARGPADPETERIRERARLVVRITARAGSYRNGLLQAVDRLTPEEASILADLEAEGLDVPQLREVLRGAHVLVDEPSLYERWRFPKSRQRLSSHHRDVDKKRYPDYGLHGPLVREKLHGRTAHGTWIQLEKTPAAFGGARLPSWQDALHLWDYVVYRVTRSNVGPWGLSRMTEKRPMYLSPDLAARTPLPAAAAPALTGALERIEERDDVTSASPDLAKRFPPPDRANELAELTFTPASARQGRGLFGSSNVWVTETPSRPARELLVRTVEPPRWSLPEARATKPVRLRIGGDRELACAARIAAPAAEERP